MVTDRYQILILSLWKKCPEEYKKYYSVIFLQNIENLIEKIKTKKKRKRKESYAKSHITMTGKRGKHNL